MFFMGNVCDVVEKRVRISASVCVCVCVLGGMHQVGV